MTLRQKVLDLLVAEGPQTLDQLSEATGAAPAVIKTALVAELYDTREIDHPKHGPMTVWAPRATLLRVDGDGNYAVVTPQPPPEKPEVIPLVDHLYRDPKRPDVQLIVTDVTATRIEGALQTPTDHPLEGRPYGTDATTFRKVWELVGVLAEQVGDHVYYAPPRKS
jgi:hypothetical protein